MITLKEIEFKIENTIVTGTDVAGRVSFDGNTAQITFTAGKNKKCPIKNLSKDEFVDLSTGEVKKRRQTKLFIRMM